MGTHEARGRKEKRKEVVVVKKDRGEGARVSFVPSFLSLRIAPRPTFPHSSVASLGRETSSSTSGGGHSK